MSVHLDPFESGTDKLSSLTVATGHVLFHRLETVRIIEESHKLSALLAVRDRFQQFLVVADEAVLIPQCTRDHQDRNSLQVEMVRVGI